MTLVTIDVPDELLERLYREASGLSKTLQERIVEVLEPAVAPRENFDADVMAQCLARLREVIQQIPGARVIGTSTTASPYWWVKLDIDISSPVAWHVVQNLGFVLNYLSLEDPLPTVFRPVSPPPYLNGGPDPFLSWVIEPRISFLDPGIIADILADRLPQPIGDEQAWLDSSDEDEDSEGQ